MMKRILSFCRGDVGKTLALTVGSPSAHRRWSMLKLLSVLVLILTIGVGNVWGVQIYKNEGANGTAGGITVSGNVNTNSSNGNPGNSLANTSASNKTFTFTGFSVSGYGALKLSIDAAFKNFPSTTNTYPYATVKFYKNNVVVKTDNTTIKWTSKVNTYSTKTIEDIPDFDKIEIVGSPAEGKTGKGAAATNYGLYMDNITLTGCPNPTSLSNGTITSSTAQLSWSDADDVGSYEVYRSTTNSAPAANATPTTTVTTKSVTFENLTESTTYYWWVRTKCSNTEKSAWVAGTSFATPAAASCSNQVTLEKGSTANGTFDLDQADGSYDNCELNFVVHVSNIIPASNAQYCNGINATGGNSTVTGPVDGVWTVTYTKGNTISSTITPTYANKTAASITFVNAGTPAPTTSGYYVGDTYELPSTNNYSCNSKTFVGWSTVEVDETDDAPAMLNPGEEVTLTASQTFYAVFATSSGSGSASYKLVESTPASWAGDYLIVYNNTYAMNTHYGNTDANTYATYADISSYYTSNTKSIAANNTTNAYAYTVASSTNGFTIKRKAATEYLGYNSDNSATGAKLRWDGTITANQNEWTLGVGSIVSVYDNSVAIRWNNNSGSERFAIYGTSGQQAIQLFKYDPGVTYSAYSTDCCTPLAQINGSVLVSHFLDTPHNFVMCLQISIRQCSSCNCLKYLAGVLKYH